MSQFTEIPLSSIVVSKTIAQAARRAALNKDDLKELASSIEALGVLQPIIVRKHANGAKGHELVAGERRVMAARIAKLKSIPAVVRELTDEQVLEVQLIENLQREGLHPMIEAEGYQELMKVHGHPIEELHERVGKSRSYVYGRMKLLALCEKARKAFYAGDINASLALLIARIPNDKEHCLQEKALEEILQDNWDGPMSFRQAKDYVQAEFMLRLDRAPFRTADPDLLPAAGDCGACLKRTGNQPELFGDVGRADVCTDPTCYRSKVMAAGEQRLAIGREKGQKIIAGKDAKKIIRWGTVENGQLAGYDQLDKVCHDDPKNRTVRKIIPKDTPTALLQDPETGQVIEVVAHAHVVKALPKRKSAPMDTYHKQKEQNAKLERAYREELYARVRPKLPEPNLADVAAALVRKMDFETTVRLCKLQGFEIPEKKVHGHKSRNPEAIVDTLPKMTKAQLGEFLNDCLYVGDLQVSWWNTSDKPERLLAAAKSVRVSAPAARAAVKKIAAKKKAKKKVGKKAKKSRSKKAA